jgi:hypothetical protein
MPFLAILEADLVSMVRSWVVRIWVVLMAFEALLTIAQALEEGIAAEALANLLGTFPLVWSTFVIVISSGAVSSEAGVVADSILSKAVTRYGYILAKMASRLIAVLGLYTVIVIPPAYIIARNTEVVLSNAGIAWAILIIGMFLLLLTVLAVTFSTLFNRTLVAVVVVWILWYGAGAILALVGGEYLSPVHIIDNLPTLLQGDYSGRDQVRTIVGFATPSIVAMTMAIVYFGRKDL